jgi:exopolysaccharide biosynthesis polyprenyl glycosylphosphotransferase
MRHGAIVPVPVAATAGSRAGTVPAPAGAPLPGDAVQPAAGQRWRWRWVVGLVAVDTGSVLAALVVAFIARFGVQPGAGGLPYPIVAALIGAAWLAGLAAADAYRVRCLGTGAEEYKRVAAGTFWAWGVTAVGCYAGKVMVARGFVVVAAPLGLLLLLGGRALLRAWLRAARAAGRARHRVLVVGDRHAAVALARQLRREPAAGLDVIGACVPGPAGAVPGAGRPIGGVPVLGPLVDIPATAKACGADTVAIAASSAVPAETVRRIAWGLEGTGVDLVVAPSMADVAGPRISVRPVSGLPLLHVDQPEFTGAKRIVKSVGDRVLAAVALLTLGPALLLVAGAIRATSRGPALFRQTRIGKAGAEFQLYKFRTMRVPAERQDADLAARNESDGLLFKIHDDPRVTRLGRLLRRTSIDELPQLLNVLTGDMALVGPRPLPVKDTDFTGDVRRRLLVRPGITGLWQVTGRSRLGWEDAVRLDLYYVENWSISLDLAILLRTVVAVARGTGAY